MGTFVDVVAFGGLLFCFGEEAVRGIGTLGQLRHDIIRLPREHNRCCYFGMISCQNLSFARRRMVGTGGNWAYWTVYDYRVGTIKDCMKDPFIK